MAKKTATKPRKTSKVLKVAPTVAVQSDRLWDRDKLKDGMLHNLGHEPVPAPETKAEYFKLLNERGLQMRHQQESTTGPERPFIPEPEHVRPASPPLSERSCRIMNAIEHVWLRYRMAETLWCEICAEENDPSGIRYLPNRATRTLRIECRCGKRDYKLTTDLSFTPSDALTLGQMGDDGYLADKDGVLSKVKTYGITSDDARMIQRYYGVLHELRISNDLYCECCHVKMEKTVTDTKIAFACPRKLVHWSETVN